MLKNHRKTKLIQEWMLSFLLIFLTKLVKINQKSQHKLTRICFVTKLFLSQLTQT